MRKYRNWMKKLCSQSPGLHHYKVAIVKFAQNFPGAKGPFFSGGA
jgi:hypothetical protein